MFSATYSLILLLLLLTIQIQSIENDITTYDGIYSSKYRKGCIIEYPLYHQQPQTTLERNLVSSSQTHGFRIHGDYPSYSYLDLNVLKRLFTIAKTYYEKIITVTNLLQSQTIYSGNLQCGRQVSSSYKSNGFNPESIDSVIIIVTENKPSQSYIAAAGACILTRWPTYGQVIFNAAYITTNLQQTGIFHGNIYVTMHELCHVYGMSSQLFGYFYTSYGSGVKKTGVTTTLGGTRIMVVTPNVLQYVQNFFGCSDGSTGGLIQNDGGGGSAGSHWERTVYLDEMMTASDWPSGLKITGITLNLLKDSNFYYSVDTTYSEPNKFGQNKGCSFAQSSSSTTPQFCTGSFQSCGFYGFYGGKCSSNDPFTQKSYIYAYSNQVCTLPQTSYSSSSYEYFNALSRCFNSGTVGSFTPYCFLAECQGSQINFQIQSNNYTCKVGDSSINTIAGIINCPDPDLFCARKNCANWCNSQSLCVKGQCMEVSLQGLSDSFSNIQIIVIIIIIVLGVCLVLCLMCSFIACIIYCRMAGSLVSEPVAVENPHYQNRNPNPDPHNFIYNSNKVQQENTFQNINGKIGFREQLPPINGSNQNIYNPYSQHNLNF